MRNTIFCFWFIALFRVFQATLFVIEATPVNATDCTNYDLTIDECLEELKQSTVDIVGYGSDGNCTLCSWCTSFYETNLTDTFFAIKTNMSTCPASPYTSISGDNYTFLYSANTWTLMKYCPTGWGQFTRTAGQFCIKIFQKNGDLASTDSTDGCVAVSGTVIGFFSEEERMYATSQLLATATTPKNTTIWINGYRTCTANSSSCGFPEGWTFSDKYLGSYAGYDFQTGEPSWHTTSSGDLVRCLQMVASSTESGVNGTIYAVSCGEATADAYGCGYLLT